MRVVSAIRGALVDQAQIDSPLFNELLNFSYNDLKRSIELEGLLIPKFDEVKAAVVDVLISGQLMITKVNSDAEIRNLLASNGQLKLRTPFNMFIGGQILDRGITISNLIAFYYGRSPKRFQQDTVLQHSRMYGARPEADLTVTRFCSPENVYQTMKRIHEFDNALREAFESGEHDRGIYFLRRDSSRKLIPCSPNKVLFSDVVSIRPGRRLVLSGFETVAKSMGAKNLAELDRKIDAIAGEAQTLKLIPLDDALKLLDLAFCNIEYDDEAEDDRAAHLVALEHLSRTTKNTSLKGKVWLMVVKDRNVHREREEGRFSNAPDTKQQSDLAKEKATDIPVLMLLRQNSREDQGWKDLPFWWPVILTPSSSATVIFANREPELAKRVSDDERSLAEDHLT